MRRRSARALALVFSGFLLPIASADRAAADAVLDCGVPAGWVGIRPEGEGPTRVDVALFVNDVNEISDAQQRFTADLVFDVGWSDPRLAPHAGCSVARGSIWDPALVLVNRRALTATLPDRLTIGPGGRVRWFQRAYGDFSVPLDLRDFPFDRQELAFVAVSTRYGPSEIELTQNDELTGRRADLLAAGWDLGEVAAQTRTGRLGNSPVEL
ncbi:MAG TPA: hypothetical protein VLA66_03700, partial [Thermoanaerobaculia bacterium]|nr:hypothetical protein [Thermoanaerobaculia bacterium]